MGWTPKSLMLIPAPKQSDRLHGLLLPPPPTPPQSLHKPLWLQERAVCRGGYHSLPKYLRTVFLALGLEPRPAGQALAVSITLVSLRQAGPGHREGRREEAGAWLPLHGGWAMQNSSCCLRLPPTAHPPGRTLAASQRLKPAFPGEIGERRAGRGPPRLPGWGWEDSLPPAFPWLRLSSPPRAGLPQGQAGSDKLQPALHPGREAVPGGRTDRKK